MSDNDAQGSSGRFPPCNLLASAANHAEWDLAIRAGVPWIDLKNPNSGPLGRPDLDTAREFAATMQQHPDRYWSIAGGELAAWNNRLDIDFCRILGTQGYIKWALAGCGHDDCWHAHLSELLKTLPKPSQCILVHYADWQACNAPDWESVVSTACNFQMQYVLMDTAIKDGRGLFDHISQPTLQQRLAHAHSLGLSVAIAGSLRLEQLCLGSELGAAWVGVRGAVCANSDRTSSFCLKKLEQAVAIVRGSATENLRRESIHVFR